MIVFGRLVLLEGLGAVAGEMPGPGDAECGGRGIVPVGVFFDGFAVDQEGVFGFLLGGIQSGELDE